jgi:hypothetical protein
LEGSLGGLKEVLSWHLPGGTLESGIDDGDGVSETSDINSISTWLIIRGDFIAYSRCTKGKKGEVLPVLN